MKGANTNVKFDPIQSWLDNVAYSHSGSKRTEWTYRHELTMFLRFIGKSADDVLKEYEASTDRLFKRKYAQYIRGWIASLMRQGDYTTKTIIVMVGAVKSFFKYNDLPLGHVPMAKERVTYHNRDITKKEIIEILSISKPRDRAFFTLMAQSGLRPYTICKLKLKHIEPDFSKGKIPCKIDVPEDIAKGKYRSYFTFVGEEAVKYLRDYLKTRANLTPESLLFSQFGKEKPLDRRNISHVFHRFIVQLKNKGIMDFKQKKKRKPSDVRLYNLRKWFRKQAHQAGFEIVQFWMGHVVKAGVEESYRPKDVEFHRRLYREKAMPFLRLETGTPSEMEQTVMELRKQLADKDGEMAQLREEIESMRELKRLAEVLERSKTLDEAFENFKRLKDKEFDRG